jgi:hypothetical protein
MPRLVDAMSAAQDWPVCKPLIGNGLRYKEGMAANPANRFNLELPDPQSK